MKPEQPGTDGAQFEATDLEPYWSAGSAPICELIPRFGAFRPQPFWSGLHDKLVDRATIIISDDAAHALLPEQRDRVADAIRQRVRRL